MHNLCMYSFFLFAEYRPCPQCGIPVSQAEGETHECDPKRRVDWELFLMRDQVEALGGRLSIESEPGQGIRVSGSLPVSA